MGVNDCRVGKKRWFLVDGWGKATVGAVAF